MMVDLAAAAQAAIDKAKKLLVGDAASAVAAAAARAVEEQGARDRAAQLEKLGIAAPQPGIVRIMPIVEVRADRVMCQFHTDEREIDRSALEGDPAPGMKVIEMTDGTFRLEGGPSSTETTTELPSQPDSEN